ncbi:MAG TPA: helix-turn-helix transcriptional regulator, partial [Candidatus Omnitrophota bacterium]|nr:helix-turn-helix transcriptional regulator [Candidatus Omnitrophota bacterium]
GNIRPWITGEITGTIKPRTVEKIIERFGLDQEDQQRFLWRCARGDRSLNIPSIIDKWRKEILSQSAKGFVHEDKIFSQVFNDLWTYSGFTGEHIQQKLKLSELDTPFSWRSGMVARDYKHRVELANLFEPYDDDARHALQLLFFGVAINETASQLLERAKSGQEGFHFGDIVRVTRLSRGLRRADVWELLSRKDPRLQEIVAATGVSILEGIENGGRLRFRTDIAESLADWIGLRGQDKKDFIGLVRKKFAFAYDPQILRHVDRFDAASRRHGLMTLRLLQGLRQEDVEQKIGISHRTYSNFEFSGGATRSFVIDLDKLGQALNIPEEDRPFFKEIYGNHPDAVAYAVISDAQEMKDIVRSFFASQQGAFFDLEKWFRKIDRGLRNNENMKALSVRDKDGNVGLALFHIERYPLNDKGQVSFRALDLRNQQNVYVVDLLEMDQNHSTVGEFQDIILHLAGRSLVEGLAGVMIIDPQDLKNYEIAGEKIEDILKDTGFQRTAQGFLDKEEEFATKGFLSMSLSSFSLEKAIARSSSAVDAKKITKDLIDTITPGSSLQELKEVYERLDKVQPFLSAAQALYNAVTSQTKMDVHAVEDILQVADIFVVEFIKEFQDWQRSAEKDEKFIVHFATGATPWISYRKLANVLSEWEDPETQEFLSRAGIDPMDKPDMSRIEAYCLDAILPQKRTDYHAFANKLSNMWDLLNIPSSRRHFLYGDLIMDGARARQMTDEEFDRLTAEIQKDGLQLAQYKTGKLAVESYQYKFLKAIDQHAQEISNGLLRQGGGHFVIWGVGPSYEGKGHLAFMEEGTPLDQKVFMDEAGFFVQADHAKENGGFDNMRNVGYVTLGFAELMHRADAKHILLATSNSK